MKILMIIWRILTINITELFHHTALIMSYYNDLKIAIEAAFDEYNNDRHQIKNASQEICYLTYQITVLWSIIKCFCECILSFQSKNILECEIKMLNNDVRRFNQIIIKEKWKKKENLENVITTLIVALNNVIIINDKLNN